MITGPLAGDPVSGGVVPDGARRITRRTLLAASGAALGTVAVMELEHALPTGLLPGAADASLRRSRFAPLVGRDVRMRPPGEAAQTVRLIEIADLPGPQMRAWRGSEDAFLLLFRGPHAPRLGQAVAAISARGLGTARLLVSPSSAGHRAQYYSAVINRTSPPRS